MNKARLIILCLMFALVASLVFSGGESEEVPMSAAETGEPQYGGTITYYHYAQSGDPPGPDIAGGGFLALHWLDKIHDKLENGENENV